MSDTAPTTDATRWLMNLHGWLSELGTANPHGGTGRWLCPNPFSAESIAPLLGIATELRLLRQDKERLDWIIAQRSDVETIPDETNSTWLWVVNTWGFGSAIITRNEDLRTALDAARQASAPDCDPGEQGEKL